MELNVECASTSTGGDLQPLTVTGTSVLPAFFFVPWSWRLQVCRRVSFYFPCYMGHICGLQCYDRLGRICGVLTVQKMAVDTFLWSRFLKSRHPLI